MPDDTLLRIRSPEFQAMAARVLEVTALTSRLNALPFDDEAGKAVDRRGREDTVRRQW